MSHLSRLATYALGLAVLALASTQSLMAAAPSAAPEIDGSTLVAGLGLATAGILILRSRMSE